MLSKTQRTLVKSAPELWELADDVTRMEAWMGELVGTPDRVPVHVTDRDPQRVLAWRDAASQRPAARIQLELAQRGFGTSVSITAEHTQAERSGADAALERLLDELGSPGRRPFV